MCPTKNPFVGVACNSAFSEISVTFPRMRIYISPVLKERERLLLVTFTRARSLTAASQSFR